MRKFVISVNGNSYEVEVEEVSESGTVSRQTVQAPPKAPVVETKKVAPEVKQELVVSEGQEVVEAPMPGNIWKIQVTEGDTVKSGDVLLILEAMKMENEILAPRDGKVVSIRTAEGSVVDTGDELIIIE